MKTVIDFLATPVLSVTIVHFDQSEDEITILTVGAVIMLHFLLLWWALTW